MAAAARLRVVRRVGRERAAHLEILVAVASQRPAAAAADHARLPRRSSSTKRIAPASTFLSMRISSSAARRADARRHASAGPRASSSSARRSHRVGADHPQPRETVRRHQHAEPTASPCSHCAVAARRLDRMRRRYGRSSGCARRPCSRSSWPTTAALISQERANGVRQRRGVAREQAAATWRLQPLEQRRVPDAAVLDHLGEARRAAPGRGSVASVSVSASTARAGGTRRSGSCRRGWLTPVLPPTEESTWASSVVGTCTKRDAALVAGGGEARRCRRPRRRRARGRRVAVEAVADQRIEHRASGLRGSCAPRRPARCSSRRAARERPASAPRGTAARRSCCDDEQGFARDVRGQPLAVADQPRADRDRIARLAGIHVDGLHGGDYTQAQAPWAARTCWWISSATRFARRLSVDTVMSAISAYSGARCCIRSMSFCCGSAPLSSGRWRA